MITKIVLLSTIMFCIATNLNHLLQTYIRSRNSLQATLDKCTNLQQIISTTQHALNLRLDLLNNPNICEILENNIHTLHNKALENLQRKIDVRKETDVSQHTDLLNANNRELLKAIAKYEQLFTVNQNDSNLI